MRRAPRKGAGGGVEERALYRAILEAPHDDAPRLVYADWLDENAERFPPPVARAERARAEFIRLQCRLARLGPGGWGWDRPTDPELAPRQRRLFFRYAPKWRRAHPAVVASAPFDRGFLRPLRALRPQQFLRHAPFRDALSDSLLLRVPADSPARRYLPEDDLFATCPLWDVHLFASDWHNDPLADQGQYEGLLASVGRSPALARVGWLKVSFFHTPTAGFLRTGHFPNVETLVLNCVPFPEVLEAVAENESFRSLRYVHLGNDHLVWAGGYPALGQRYVLAERLHQANLRHLPHGEMRAVLRAILRDAPVPPPPPEPTPTLYTQTFHAAAGPDRSAGSFTFLLAMVTVGAIMSMLGRGFMAEPQQFKFPSGKDVYRLPQENPKPPPVPWRTGKSEPEPPRPVGPKE